MNNRFVLMVTGLLILGSEAGALIGPDLEKILEKSGPGEKIPVNIVLKEQVDPLVMRALTRGLTKEEKRLVVVEEMKRFSESRQEGILSELSWRESLGEAEEVQSFWLINAIHGRLTQGAIEILHTRPEVYYIEYDLVPGSLLVPEKGGRDNPRTMTLEWGVSLINAPAVWAMGYTGQGVVVGEIDTGVNYNHVDLADHLWTDANYPNHGWNFELNNNNPMDVNGHGTHVAGTIAGDGTAGDTTGVAPDAQVMCLRVRTVADSIAENQVWAAMQFCVSPPLSPTNGADVISMSLGWLVAWNPRMEMWRTNCTNVGLAGIAMIVAAGNERGSTFPPYGLRVPGNVPSPWINPENTGVGGTSDVISIAATDNLDNIASFSSPGPVTWDTVTGYNDWAYPPGLLKPDVSAPGVCVTSLSAFDNNGYAACWSGTSMATPHTSGMAALLLSKVPSLSPDQINEILETTAIDLGPVGKDNDYGAGRIDALAAFLAAGDSLDPNAPDSLQAFSDCTTPSSVLLTWRDPTEYLGGDSLGGNLGGIIVFNAADTSIIDTVAPSVETYTHTPLIKGDYRSYYVVAYTVDDSTSPRSGIASAWVGGHPEPAPPSNMAAYSDSSMPTSISLTWNDPTTSADGGCLNDLAGIRVYHSGPDTLIASVAPAVESLLVTGLLNNTWYAFYATAIDTEIPVNESNPSNIAGARTGGSIRPPYFEDFEGSDGGFSGTGGWEWGTPTGPGPGGAYSGVNVWGTVLNGYYGVDNADWYLDSSPIDLFGVPWSTLTFWHWYSTESYWDGGNVKISTDGGSTWTTIFPVGGYPYAYVPGLDEAGYSGATSGWEQERFDLTAFVGNTIIIRWHFGTDSSVNSYPGWYLDDIYVTVPLANDVGVVSIDNPGVQTLPNYTVTPQATVENPGLNVETFNVAFLIEESGNPVYGDTQTVTSLAVGDSLQVSFADWVSGNEGTIYDITVSVILPTDMNPFNNTKTGVTEATCALEVAYDDAAFNWMSSPPWSPLPYIGVRFSIPPTFVLPFEIVRARLFLSSTNPLEEVLVCPGDLAGQPEYLNPYETIPNVQAPGSNSWAIVDFPAPDAVNTRQEIWVLARWPAFTSLPYIGVDDTAPVDYRSYYSYGPPSWNLFTGGEYMVRLSLCPSGLTGAEEFDPISILPRVFRLGQNRPNPFSRNTMISYDLPKDSHASLKIYDVSGRHVRTLVDGDHKAGYFFAPWDGHDEMRREVANGIYFARINAGEFRSTKKMVVLK